jgi:hypothetical protein
MKSSNEFRPVWKTGFWLHCAIAVILAGLGGFLAYLAFQQTVGGLLILCLFGALVLLAALPIIVYRAYGLYHASYTIEREGLSIRWGLRKEDIPLTEVEWVHSADDLMTPLKAPAFSLPGAYLGEGQHPDLGRVEFIASDRNAFVVIETISQTLVLSPENPEEFIDSFQRTLEMGSLTPIEAFSTQPAQFIQEVFSHPVARASLVTSLLLTLLLAVLTSLLIPRQQIVSMGITATGAALEPVPSTRLLILPILGAFALVLDTILGFYLYRKDSQQIVAYFLWGAGVITPLLLILALLIMVF